MEDEGRELTDEELQNWQLIQRTGDIGDSLHRHFIAKRGRLMEWTDVSCEGRRVWNIMFSEEVEELSPIDDVLSAIAAASWHAAFRLVAQALGQDEEVVAASVEEMAEELRGGNATAGADGLMQRILDFQADLEKIRDYVDESDADGKK